MQTLPGSTVIMDTYLSEFRKYKRHSLKKCQILKKKEGRRQSLMNMNLLLQPGGDSGRSLSSEVTSLNCFLEHSVDFPKLV